MTDDNRKLPEWEEAFTEYAKKDAPDLLPGILVKINAEAETPLTAVSTKESAKPAKKPFWMRRQFLLSASAFAATLLLIAILIRIPHGIKQSDETSSSEPVPTTAAADLEYDDRPNQLVDSANQEKRGDRGVSMKEKRYITFPVDGWRTFLGTQTITVDEPANNALDGTKSETATSQYSLTTPSIEKVAIGEAVVTSKETLYHIVVDGTVHPTILIRSDEAKTGDTYDSVYLTPTQEGIEIDNTTYLICTMVIKK